MNNIYYFCIMANLNNKVYHDERKCRNHFRSNDRDVASGGS